MQPFGGNFGGPVAQPIARPVAKGSFFKSTEFADAMQMAQVFYDSGMFDNVGDAKQAFVKIIAGRKMGLSEFDAMMGIHIIQTDEKAKNQQTGRWESTGRKKTAICLGAHAIASLVKSSGKYDFRVITPPGQEEQHCIIQWFERHPDTGEWRPTGKSSFTRREAEQRGYMNRTVWQQNLPDMLFCRAVTRGKKQFASDVASGITRSSEEIQDHIAIEGGVSDTSGMLSTEGMTAEEPAGMDKVSPQPTGSQGAAPTDTANETESEAGPMQPAAEDPPAGAGKPTEPQPDKEDFQRLTRMLITSGVWTNKHQRHISDVIVTGIKPSGFYKWKPYETNLNLEQFRELERQVEEYILDVRARLEAGEESGDEEETGYDDQAT